MRYRGFQDQKISSYVAFLIIGLFGIIMTSVILHAISSVNYFDTHLSELTN